MVKNRSKHLFMLWLTAFVLLYVIVLIGGHVYSYSNDLTKIDLPNTMKLLLSGVLLVFYCPPLIPIYNQARQESDIKIKRMSVFLFITISVAALGSIINILFT